MNKNWLLALMLFFFAACNIDSGNFELGDDLVDSQSKVFLNDTFSVKLSTVQIDSMRASSLDTIMVGKYEHPQLGSLDLEHYFQVQYQAVGEEDIFDSLAVRMNYSGYYMGDTADMVEFSVYQLSEELDIYDEANISNDYNYNVTHSYSYDEANLVGKYSFRPSPSRDSIEFNLDADFSKTMFDWIQNDENDENTAVAFAQFQKGFVIKQTGGAPIALGFNNSKDTHIQLHLYTHLTGVMEETNKEYELKKTISPNMNYTAVSYDRTGTPFANLVEQKEELNAADADGLAVIQGSSGLMIKVDFPSINQIGGMDNTALVRTDLILVPDYAANDADRLPEELYLYYTNKNNDFLSSSAFKTSDGEYISATLQADRLNDEYYYMVDITNYMAAQMSDNNYDEDNGLVVAFQSTHLMSSASTLFLSNTGKSGRMKTKLNLYFLYNNE